MHKISKDIQVVKPNDTFLLERNGLWGRDIEFFEDKDKVTVKKKIERYRMNCRVQFEIFNLFLSIIIYQAFFPENIGGFKMLKSNKNGKLLHLIGDGPIVDGKGLKSVSAKKHLFVPVAKGHRNK